MFRYLTSILTVSAMLLHSILGCCTHHAHACEHGHAVENCAVGHDEHAAGVADHGHEHSHHQHHGDEPRHEAEHGLTAHDGGHGDHKSHECPHGPCGFDCEGGDCTYTVSSKVKTPAPSDGGLWLPVAISQEYVSPVAGLCFGYRCDAGPPEVLSASCCRTMTQVWLI